MATTANYGFYTPPLTGVSPDVPRDLKSLADGVDSRIKSQADAQASADRALCYQATWDLPAGINVGNAVNYAPAFSLNVINTLGATRVNRLITPGKAGRYKLEAFFGFRGASSGQVRAQIQLNPTADNIADGSVPGGTAITVNSEPLSLMPGYDHRPVSVSREYTLSASDSVMFICWQNSGAALGMKGEAYFTWCSITYLGAA